MCAYTPQSSSSSSSSSALLPREVAPPVPASWEGGWHEHCSSGAQALFYSSLWDGNAFCSLSGASGGTTSVLQGKKTRNQRSLSTGWDPLDLRGSDLCHSQMQKRVMEHEAALQHPALPPWHSQGSSVTLLVP